MESVSSVPRSASQSARRRHSPVRTDNHNTAYEAVLQQRRPPSTEAHGQAHQHHHHRHGEVRLPSLARATSILEADHLAKEHFKQSYIKALNAKVSVRPVAVSCSVDVIWTKTRVFCGRLSVNGPRSKRAKTKSKRKKKHGAATTLSSMPYGKSKRRPKRQPCA